MHLGLESPPHTDGTSTEAGITSRLVALWKSRAINAVLIACIAWGLWTTVNIVRLGPRGNSPVIYWPSGLLIVLLTCGAAWSLVRRMPRG